MESTFSNKNKKILFIFFGCSLLIHLSLSFTYLKNSISFNFPGEEDAEQKIVIKLQNLKPQDLKQIVQSERSKENDKLDKAKFLSDKNNIFLKETKNANVGTFKSAAKGDRNALAHKDQQVQKKTKKEKFKKIKFSDLGFKSLEEPILKQKKKKSLQAMRRKGLASGKKTGEGLGRSNDFLEDMPLGDFTKLNTQEYEFYGFYHRIREKLEQFWGNNIQQEAEKIFKSGRSIASESNLVTGLTIFLNKKGEIVDINLKSTSGVKELDDAAIESFNQAGPFPNPPKGMVKNGRAVIEWGFVVNT